MGAEEFHGEAPETRSPENKELSPEQLENYRNAEASIERAVEDGKRIESGEKTEAEARH